MPRAIDRKYEKSAERDRVAADETMGSGGGGRGGRARGTALRGRARTVSESTGTVEGREGSARSTHARPKGLGKKLDAPRSTGERSGRKSTGARKSVNRPGKSGTGSKKKARGRRKRS